MSFPALQKGYLAVDSDLYLKLFPVAAKIREGGDPIEETGKEKPGTGKMAAAVAQTVTTSVASSAVQATKEMAAAVVMMPQVEIPDEKDQRFSVLSYEQVNKDHLITVGIHSNNRLNRI